MLELYNGFTSVRAQKARLVIKRFRLKCLKGTLAEVNLRVSCDNRESGIPLGEFTLIEDSAGTSEYFRVLFQPIVTGLLPVTDQSTNRT